MIEAVIVILAVLLIVVSGVQLYYADYNPKIRRITANVSIDRKGNIIFSDEEIASAERRIAEMEKQEKEWQQYLSENEYTATTVVTRCGEARNYYHYTKSITEAEYKEGTKDKIKP